MTLTLHWYDAVSKEAVERMMMAASEPHCSSSSSSAETTWLLANKTRRRKKVKSGKTNASLILDELSAAGSVHDPDDLAIPTIHPPSPTCSHRMTASAPVPPYPAGKEFSVIPGWFIYDEARESPSPFGAIEDNFGLEPGQTWQGLIEKIKGESSRAVEASSRLETRLTG